MSDVEKEVAVEKSRSMHTREEMEQYVNGLSEESSGRRLN